MILYPKPIGCWERGDPLPPQKEWYKLEARGDPRPCTVSVIIQICVLQLQLHDITVLDQYDAMTDESYTVK